MNTVNQHYENHYGVQLLNDLHNYFPEILYGNRFENDSLVQYIRQQVSSRFNLFTNAQHNYYNSNVNNLQNQQINRIATIPQQNNHILYDTILFTGTNQTTLNTTPLNTTTTPLNTSAIGSIANLFQAILQGANDMNNINDINDLESVVIHPTDQQIETSSSIVEIMNSQNSCAICQEHMNPNDRIRRINQCHHMFHNHCILTAFQTSPRCPVCRHDIRF